MSILLLFIQYNKCKGGKKTASEWDTLTKQLIAWLEIAYSGTCTYIEKDLKHRKLELSEEYGMEIEKKTEDLTWFGSVCMVH